MDLGLLIDDAKVADIANAARTANACQLFELATTLQNLLADRGKLMNKIVALEETLRQKDSLNTQLGADETSRALKRYCVKPLTSYGKPLPSDIAIHNTISVDGPGEYKLKHDIHGYEASYRWSTYDYAKSKYFATLSEAIEWLKHERISRVEELCDEVCA